MPSRMRVRSSVRRAMNANGSLTAYPSARIGKIHRLVPGVSRRGADDDTPARELVAPFLRDPDKPIVLAIAARCTRRTSFA